MKDEKIATENANKAKLLAQARLMRDRMQLVEHALLRFVEEIDDWVPSDEEIEREGFHAQFSRTPLTMHEQDGHAFTNYYVWRGKHVLAHGFFDTERPTDLSVVRLPDDGPWPPALCAAVEQWSDARKKQEKQNEN